MSRDDIAPFPNPGVRLLQEDEHVAIWEEIFVPGVATAPHRHLRDYIAFFPDSGELTVTHLDGERETYSLLAGAMTALPGGDGQMRGAIAASTVLHSRVPAGGTAHVALNEGSTPLRMILIEVKGATAERD